MRQGDIFYPNDPRFEKTPRTPEVLADILEVDCYDQDGELVTRKAVAFNYFDTGDGLDVRVFYSGIFRQDVELAIADHLKTRVSSWDFAG